MGEQSGQPNRGSLGSRRGVNNRTAQQGEFALLPRPDAPSSASSRSFRDQARQAGRARALVEAGNPGQLIRANLRPCRGVNSRTAKQGEFALLPRPIGPNRTSSRSFLGQLRALRTNLASNVVREHARCSVAKSTQIQPSVVQLSSFGVSEPIRPDQNP